MGIWKSEPSYSLFSGRLLLLHYSVGCLLCGYSRNWWHGQAPISSVLTLSRLRKSPSTFLLSRWAFLWYSLVFTCFLGNNRGFIFRYFFVHKLWIAVSNVDSAMVRIVLVCHTAAMLCLVGLYVVQHAVMFVYSWTHR